MGVLITDYERKWETEVAPKMAAALGVEVYERLWRRVQQVRQWPEVQAAYPPYEALAYAFGVALGEYDRSKKQLVQGPPFRQLWVGGFRKIQPWLHTRLPDGYRYDRAISETELEELQAAGLPVSEYSRCRCRNPYVTCVLHDRREVAE